MNQYYRAVRPAARLISEACELTASALRDGRIEQEPAFTDRLVTNIEERLNDENVRGILWRAKTLTDRGPSSQEKKFGADIMGVLKIDLPDYKVTKGFLAQAKLIRRNRIDDAKGLRAQCENMLRLSPDAFVFLYSIHGVKVVPAISVLGSTLSPLELYSRSLGRFFEEHLQCFIGDKNIDSPTPEGLKSLQDASIARTTLLLEAKSGYETYRTPSIT